MASLALVFDVLAKDNASKTFRDVGSAADRAGKQTSVFGASMAGAMKMAGAALIGGGLIQGFKSLYEAADESRRIGNLTAAVIKSTGGAAGISAKQVGDLAGAIAAKTGVDDEAIQSGQNLLLTFTKVRNETGKGNDIFNQTTQIMTDMSAALGTEASGSAIQLGKALNDPIKGVTALTKVGVSFTAQQKEQIKTLVESGDLLGAQKIILAELSKEFGGAAEAAATPLGKLRVQVGNLAEQVGGYLLPIVDRAATWFSVKLLPALQDVGGIVMGVAVPAFQALGTIVGALADAFNALPGPLQAGVVALGAFAVLRGPVSSALETIGLKALYMKDAIANAGTGVGGLKAAGSGLLGFLGGPWGLAIAGATVGLSFLTSGMGKNSAATEAAKAAQRDFAQAVREANGVITESLRLDAAKSAQQSGLLDAAERAGIGLNRVTDAVMGNRDAYNEVSGALARYIEAQTLGGERSGSRAGQVLTEQGRAAKEARTALDELAPTISRNRVEQEQLNAATSATGRGVQTFAQQMEAVRAELDGAKSATDAFKLSLDILSGETVSMLQVETAFGDALRKAEGAMEGLDGSVLNADGTLNAYSESGSRAADVLLDVRNSGNDLIATMIQQGATAADVARKEADLRDGFLRTAAAMGITGGNADRLADQILGVTGERQLTISADTGQATGAIGAVQRALDGLRDKRVTVTTVGVHVGTRFGGGTIEERAVGGPISANMPYLVGERGPELVFPSRAGFVATAAQTRDLRRGGDIDYGRLAAAVSGRGATLAIENYNEARQSPREIAEEMAFTMRGLK